MSLDDIKTSTQSKMDQSIAAFKNNLSKIRTGRANPALLDSVQVEYYGSVVPLSQVANVALIDSRTISVQPWEKGMGAKIEKAIRESDLGLNPASMGDLIRVPMPAMSEERRREMTKLVRTEGENAKIAVRNCCHVLSRSNGHPNSNCQPRQVPEQSQSRPSAPTRRGLGSARPVPIHRRAGSPAARPRRCAPASP